MVLHKHFTINDDDKNLLTLLYPVCCKSITIRFIRHPLTVNDETTFFFENKHLRILVHIFNVFENIRMFLEVLHRCYKNIPSTWNL